MREDSPWEGCCRQLRVSEVTLRADSVEKVGVSPPRLHSNGEGCLHRPSEVRNVSRASALLGTRQYLHSLGEIGIDAFQADRSPTHMYRTTPVAGLWTHQKGGFFHDGRFATLLDVVNQYDTQFNLNLSDANKRDLVEYLKGI